MVQSTPYSEQFFRQHEPATRRSAEIVVPFLLSLISPESVIDVGCGIGTWLNVLELHGVRSVRGLDGGWVRREALKISPDSFSVVDLTQPLAVSDRFDLALCLEVAEHLPATSGPTLVEGLCRVSDIVLFSAAIPRQGGTGHLNERWQSFWLEEFRRCGYTAIDWLRPLIWDDDRVAWWYRQNMLLYVADERLPLYPQLDEAQRASTPGPANLVHPDLLALKAAEIDGLRRSMESSKLSRILKRIRRTAKGD